MALGFRQMTAGLLLFGLAAPATIRAQDLADLEIASQYAARKQAERIARAGTAHLTVDPAAPTFRVGDQWSIVAALPVLRAEGPSSKQESARFSFEVTAVDSQGATLHVVRHSGGAGTQTMESSLRIDFRGRVTATLKPGSLRAAGISLFPLSLPDRTDVEDAASRRVIADPELPAAATQALSSSLGQRVGVNGVESYQFDLEDVMGRPVQVVWRKGDPWPVFVSGAAGVAVMTRLTRGAR